MNYFDNLQRLIRDAYRDFLDVFSSPSYVFADVPYKFDEGDTETREGESKLVNALFSHKEQHQKGSTHLHRSPYMITVHANGRGNFEFDKRKKPKGMTLTQWIMEMAGVSHKEASKAIKCCN